MFTALVLLSTSVALTEIRAQPTRVDFVCPTENVPAVVGTSVEGKISFCSLCLQHLFLDVMDDIFTEVSGTLVSDPLPGSVECDNRGLIGPLPNDAQFLQDFSDMEEW